jgi:hypothetical protein
VTALASLVNYVCWSPDVVTATIPTEAATPSKEVLLATHAPLKITRRGGHGPQGGSESITEQDVLAEFLETPSNNGVLVATVLGESGAGKSHLVRWAEASIPKRDGRHVVYLQKTETSLKDVVEALLVGQTDPEFEEIRRKVSTLGSGMTIDEMEHKLLAELAEALRTAQAETAHERPLVGENGLRLFFTDPLFEKHLLREGSFIRRRAEHALRGRSADEGDVPLEFTAAELPLDIGDYADVREAARATQTLFQRLASNPAYQNAAAKLINDNLDIAVMRAASLAVGDIGQAFKRIREKLVGDEIILLIEDVALIQGVRRDLLDAVIEVGVHQGDERYATVRTLMAVTPSYYREQLPDTFRRRSEATSPVYVVDVDLDSETADEDDLVDFVGRYLNAARVGRREIESEYPSRPNACTACPLQAVCHETFGASRQEYGLYPYNKAAVVRAVRACADVVVDSGETHKYFNPRKVLSRAVRNVLIDNASVIRQGTFPHGDFLAEESAEAGLPRLSINVREQIETSFSQEEAGRVEALITFWGRVGAEPVSDEVLAAFSHPALPEVLGHTGVLAEVRVDPKQLSKDTSGALPPSVQSQLDAIHAWSEGQVLPQAVARDIRSIFSEALLARVTWLDPVIKEPDSRAISRAVPNNAKTVSIEGADENLTRNEEPIIRLSRNARMGVTFKGLVLAKAGFPERAGDALPRVDALVAQGVDEAKARIIKELGVSDDDLVHVAASLIRGAVACGVFPERPTDSDYVAACLWQDSARRSDRSRLPEWDAAYEAYVSVRGKVVERLLEAVGAAQGTGSVHAIDFFRLVEITKRARRDSLGESDPVVPDWGKEAADKLKALSRLGTRQIAHWQELINRVRSFVPAGASLTDTIEAVGAARRDGQPQGLVLVSNLQDLESRDAAARLLDAKGITEVEKLLGEANGATGMDLQRIVGTVAGVDLKNIVEYLEYSSGWISTGIAQAEQGTPVAADVDEQLNEAIAYWLTIVGQGDSDE